MGCKKVICEEGLEITTSRNLPLFIMSCVARGYTRNLRAHFGMSYGATGTLGKSNWMSALFNNHRIIKDIEEYLEGHHPDDTLLVMHCQKIPILPLHPSWIFILPTLPLWA